MDTQDAIAYSRWFETELGRRVWSDERLALTPLLGTLEGQRVLDAGCGDGRFALELTREGARVTGVDLSSPMLRLAASRAADEGRSISLVQGNVEDLPFPSESFDLVVAVTVLCFLPNPGSAVREFARVLRPHGRLVVGELGRWSVWAAWRRLRARFGNRAWQGARFWTRGDLDAVVRAAGLRPMAKGSAVFFPPSPVFAMLCRPIEAGLRNRTVLGAAFIAVRADKPRSEPEPQIDDAASPPERSGHA